MAEENMPQVIGQWLEARSRFNAHGRDYLAAYCAADARLLAAFAADWLLATPRCSPRHTKSSGRLSSQTPHRTRNLSVQSAAAQHGGTSDA